MATGSCAYLWDRWLMCTTASKLSGVGAADDQPKSLGREFRDQAQVIARHPEHEYGRSAWEAEVAKPIRRSPADRRALRHQFRTSLPDFMSDHCPSMQRKHFSADVCSCRLEPSPKVLCLPALLLGGVVAAGLLIWRKTHVSRYVHNVHKCNW